MYTFKVGFKGLLCNYGAKKKYTYIVFTLFTVYTVEYFKYINV